MAIKIPDNIDSKFRFIILAASRAKQLLNGAPPKIEPRGRKPSTVAIEEVQDGLVNFEILPDEDESAEEDEEE